MKKFIIPMILIFCFILGCIESGEEEEGTTFSSPEEVIEKYFSYMDEGEYEKAMNMMVLKNGTFAKDDGSTLLVSINVLETEFGENGEFIEFNHIKITTENEWSEVENGSSIRLTELVVHFEYNLNGTESTEEENWVIIYFSEEDTWGIIFDYYSDESNDQQVEIINVKGRIYASADAVTLEVIDGNIEWEGYRVIVDSISLTTNAEISSAGNIATFQDPQSNWDAEVGEDYTVKIINDIDNRVVWEDNIIARV